MTQPAKTEIVEGTPPGEDLAARVLSVGIIGAGEIVSRIHLPVLSACENIRIAYIADKNPEAARSVGGSYNIFPVSAAYNSDELPQTDVVLLAVPVTARLPYYELFASRGTSVLAEKPLAASSSDGERICNLYAEYSLACGFQRRGYANVALAKLLVAENWFGPLRSMSISEGALTTKTGADSRFYDDAGSGGGGVLMDLGCHSLDVAIYITGATEAIPLEQHFVLDGGVDREIGARLALRTAHGSCELDYLVTWLRPAKNNIELRFEDCIVELSCQPTQHVQVRGIRNGRDVASLAMKRPGAATVYQAFYSEWTAFLEGLRNRTPSLFSARSCLPTIRAVEALYRAGKRNP